MTDYEKGYASATNALLELKNKYEAELTNYDFAEGFFDAIGDFGYE